MSPISRMRPIRWLPSWLMFFCFVTSWAQGEGPCRMTQLVDVPVGTGAYGSDLQASTGFDRTIDEKGQKVLVQSNLDLTGQNASLVRHLFLLDLSSDTFTQLDISESPVSSPVLSGNGKHVALRSWADLEPGENPAGDQHLFFLEISQAWEQLTPVDTPPNRNGSMTRNGEKVAFTTGPGPAGVRLYDTATKEMNTVASQGHNLGVWMHPEGSEILFSSTGDYVGENGDGNREIFLYEVATSNFVQITHTLTGYNMWASMSEDRSRIIFESTADHTGENPGGERHLFLYELADGVFQQLTQLAPGRFSSINGDGSLIVFGSKADPVGKNPDGNSEIFALRLPAGDLFQLTESSGAAVSSEVPHPSRSGSRIIFGSFADLTGENPAERRTVFLASCAFLYEVEPAKAIPGSEITLRGAGFEDGPVELFIGGIKITDFRIVDDATLVASVPTDLPAGPAGVEVRTANGSSALPTGVDGGLEITQPIPTLSEWGLLLLTALLAATGAWILMRRNEADRNFLSP